MKLNQEIKRMLNAMAYAHAGDYLSPQEKLRVLADASVTSQQSVSMVTVASKLRPQVGLYVGSELSADAVHYVAQTCVRLQHGLTVLSFHNTEDIEALLDPYQSLFEAAGIELSLLSVPGEPPAGLSQVLRRHPEIAFLVCNESGYFGHGLLNGNQHSILPVPVVLVAANETAAAISEPTAAVRAA